MSRPAALPAAHRPDAPAWMRAALPIIGAAVLLVLLTVGIYAPAARNGFIWDDDDHVSRNQTLDSVDGLRRIWCEPGATPQYYPLVFTSFWIEQHLWGRDPAGYHVINLLLHSANAVLVFLLLRRLRIPGAWLAAAVFALHPVHVESVVWITERKNTLSGLFYLLALGAYLRFHPLEDTTPAPGRRITWWLLAFAAFVAALLSKTVTCSLPAAILLLTWWKRGRLAWRDVLPLLPFFVVGALAAASTVFLEKHDIGATGPEFEFSFVQRVLIAGRAAWFYAAKLLWPADLAFIYPRWDIDPRAGWQYVFPAAAVALLVLLFVLRRRFGRGALGAVLFFGGTLLPALGFFNVYPMLFSFVADHFQYLASLGLIVLVIGGAAAWLRRRPLAQRIGGGAAGAALLITLALLTSRQIPIYVDLETLWRDTLAKNPTSWMANYNLANRLQDRREFREAVQYYEAALRIRPFHERSANNLAAALGQLREFDRAVQIYTDQAAQHPQNYMPPFNLGVTKMLMDRPAEAIAHFEDAIRLNPQAVEPYVNLANARIRTGAREAAVAPLRAALKLRPNDAKAALLLADTLLQLGQLRPAVEQYRVALPLNPNAAGGFNNLAWILATNPDESLRDGDAAVRLAQRAVELTSGRDAGMLDTLAAALAESGAYADAVQAAEAARQLALTQKDAALVSKLDARLALYRAGRPFRDSAR